MIRVTMFSRASSFIMFCLALPLWAMTASAASDKTIEALRQFPVDGPPDRLNEHFDALRGRLAVAPDETWIDIKSLLEAPEPNAKVKYTIFAMVMNANSQPVAADLIATVADWGEAHLGRKDRILEQGVIEPAWVCGELLNRLSSDAQWREWAVEAEATPQLLTVAALGGVGSLVDSNKAVDVLLSLPLSTSEKSSIALSIILRQPRGGTNIPLYSLLNNQAVTTLRNHIHNSIAEDQSIHFGAISAVAFLGDEASKPLIVSAAELTAATSPRVAQMIRNRAEFIDLQKPPANLLKFIASPERASRIGSTMIPWAIARAISLGLPREEVRHAMIQHADNLIDAQLEWMVVPLCETGLRHGVFVENDLTDWIEHGLPIEY